MEKSAVTRQYLFMSRLISEISRRRGLLRVLPRQQKRRGQEEGGGERDVEHERREEPETDLASGTQTPRVFGVWNARADSPFARATWSVELVENPRLELGGGAFLGDDGELVGLIADSDFAVARLRLYF
jgi:hypothetical protein